MNRLNDKQKEKYFEMMKRRERLRSEMLELLPEVSDIDEGVAEYFDIESDKMLSKKIRVLRELKDGKSVEEIGKDYFDILEKFDKGSVKDGEQVEVGDWIYDPKKYK